MRPVYGVNLRQALRVPLLLSAELYETKRHKYVDRRSKFSKNLVDECSSVPSAVFNSFSNVQNTFYQVEPEMGYLSPGCRVYDLIDEDCADEEAMEVDEGKKKGYCNLIVDVTKTWKVSDKFKEPTKN